MALEQKLSVRMSQRLVMTPSLQQAIKLLQMSKLELVEEVQQEMLENPVLEESEVAPGERPETETQEQNETTDPFSDIDYESYFQDVENNYAPRAPREAGEELPSFEATLAEMPRRARTLLRLQIIDHLTLEEIGAFYQISRATVARHLADARALLVTGTQGRLVATLSISSEELGELMRLVASSLYSTLPRLLTRTETPGITPPSAA